MALNTLTKLVTFTRPIAMNKILTRCYSIYEPDYLEAAKPKYPLYPPLLVQIRGYDYPILESYQSWVHKITEAMDFDVDDSFAMPAKELKVIRYKPKTTVVEAEFFLNIYERDLKVSNVPSVRLPIYIRILEAALPAGVMLDIDKYDSEKENRRYIPDKELLELKKELESITQSNSQKK